MPAPSRPHEVTALTAPELDRARRDLAVSLALPRPGSSALDMIAAHIAAMDAERAQRSAAGHTGGGSLPAPVSAVTPAGHGPERDSQPPERAAALPVTPPGGCLIPAAPPPGAGPGQPLPSSPSGQAVRDLTAIGCILTCGGIACSLAAICPSPAQGRL